MKTDHGILHDLFFSTFQFNFYIYIMKGTRLKYITSFFIFISCFSLAQDKTDNLGKNITKNQAYNYTKKLFELSEEYKLSYLLPVFQEKNNSYNYALVYYKKYAELKDHIISSFKTPGVTRLEKNIELSDRNHINFLKIKEHTSLRIIVITGILIFIILLYVHIRLLRLKSKTNKILQKQNEIITNKNLEINEKKKNLTKINTELEKLNIATSQTDNAIIITGADGKIEWVNDGFTRFYGYTLEKLIQDKTESYIELSSNTDIKEIFQKALSEKKSQIYESDAISKEGKKCRIHTTLTPILDQNNEVIRFIAIDSDVTKLKEVEEELQRLLVTKDKFFSIIAHDLKNPFNSMMGLAQLLVHGYDRLKPEKVKYFHQNLYQISKNGYELLVNLLEWSRSQMGTIQFTPVKINLCALCEETFSLYNSKANQKEISLTNNINENSEIIADQNMIKTILRNLVSNALKFTDRGGAIEINEKDIDGFKEITVWDTGIGIEPKNIKRLFRLDEGYTTAGTAEETGTGLGLILCKEFVEKHGGKIWVESKVGFGSKFNFTLPLNN